MPVVMKFQITAILLLGVFNGIARDASVPFIRNYKANEYKASQQSWAIAQDKRGIMYFGNNDGLLEFDGVNWRRIRLAGVRSIAMDSSNRIYTGLENDIGYLDPDNNGNYHYFSLKSKMPEIYRNITTIFDALKLGGKIIFQSRHNTYIYENDTIKVMAQRGGAVRSFIANNSWYLWEEGKGLFLVENNSREFIEGSEILANLNTRFIFPCGDQQFLVTTTNGLYMYSPKQTKRFYKAAEFREVDHFLSQNRAYCGTVLPNGDFAVGTSNAGIIIFDRQGKIKNTYNADNGLQENSIYYLSTDNSNQLWSATDNGISLIQNNLPFRLHTDKNGLKGTPMCLKIFDGHLYAGTGQGLFIRNQAGDFESIPGTEGQVFDLYDHGGSLLMTNSASGIFEIRGNHATQVPGTSHISALWFETLKNKSGQVLVGHGDGLAVVENKNSQWRLKHLVKGFNASCYECVEDNEGNIWTSNNVDLFKLRLNGAMDSVISYRQFSISQGLPSTIINVVKMNSGEVVFAAENGIYLYQSDKDRFVLHPDFPMIKGFADPFLPLKNGEIWFEEGLPGGVYEKGLLKYADGKYTAFKIPFYKFSDLNSAGNQPDACIDADGTIWFGTNAGLMQYNPTLKLLNDKPFNTLIRKVVSRDSVLFGGALSSNSEFLNIHGARIPWGLNDVILHFAATFYEDPENNLYSYRLTGADTTWSAWVNDHKKEYTNLPEGSYRFEVRSKNQYQVTGSTASYSFTILAPWYRTWWAYLLYGITTVLVFYLLLHFRTRQLRKKSQALGKVVEQRTAQIQEQKNNVEQLSRIGRDITSSLSIENIIHTVYENVNNLMDASVFTIGLYNPDKNCLEFPATIEKNQLLHPFSVLLSDENRLAAWCFNHRQDVIINDYARDYNKYVVEMSGPITGENPESVLYLPLWNKEKAIGVISAQSFSKNAYTDYHINMLRNLATYSAIALENADAYRQLAALLDNLKTTQDRLITQSKLAALGELTAGIAHEIQNPLNFVNNFSEVNKELIEEASHANDAGTPNEVKELLTILKDNENKINHHGKRADAIVKGMLQHSRSISGVKEPTDINALADEYLRLAYHGLRAKDKSFHATMKTDFDESIGRINIIPQDIGRVLLNLINNAFYAVNEKKANLDFEYSDISKDLSPYEPAVSIRTIRSNGIVEVSIKDNGNGIPQNILDKIFQPFFTTKPAGQGTGLGLSMSYDIVKAHGGELKVETRPGEGTKFLFTLLS